MRKPHVHAALIKLWADGEKIEVKMTMGNWEGVPRPVWQDDSEYRIKPQQKPDKVHLGYIGLSQDGMHFVYGAGNVVLNVRMIFDGETNELKAVEMVK